MEPSDPPRLLVSFGGGSEGRNPPVLLRRNADETCPMRWDSAASDHREIPVAFAFAAPEGDRIGIEVRAVGIDRPIRVRAISHDAAENVLGWLQETTIEPDVAIICELVGSRISGVGVDARTILLWWQVAEAEGEWRDVGTQRIRLYTMPARPAEPWLAWGSATATESPYHVWTDVLEWACRWARGARDTHEAAARITRGVYGLGREGTPGRITYDDNGRKYGSVAGLDPVRNELTVETFYAMAFLRRIAGEESRGGHLNCYDCAGAVAMFGSAIGCPLRKVSFGRLDVSAFRLHPMRILGEIEVNDPHIGGQFWEHAVAWSGPLDERGQVYDASTALEDDSDLLTSEGLSFGLPGEVGSYRVRLTPDEADLRLNREYRPLLLVPPNVIFAPDGD